MYIWFNKIEFSLVPTMQIFAQTVTNMLGWKDIILRLSMA